MTQVTVTQRPALPGGQLLVFVPSDLLGSFILCVKDLTIQERRSLMDVVSHYNGNKALGLESLDTESGKVGPFHLCLVANRSNLDRAVGVSGTTLITGDIAIETESLFPEAL